MTICTRATAIHEAGHIVAAKRYLLGYYEIIVRPDGGPIIDGRGRKSYDLGMMDGPAFDYDVMEKEKDHIPKWNFGDDHADMVFKINELGFRHLVTTQAGPIAEARHSRRSIAAIALGPGYGDFRQSKSIIDFLSRSEADEDRLWRDSAKAAAKIIRAEWQTVLAVADAIRAGERVGSDHPAMAHISYLEGAAITELVAEIVNRLHRVVI